jgi:hypothetical protein
MTDCAGIGSVRSRASPAVPCCGAGALRSGWRTPTRTPAVREAHSFADVAQFRSGMLEILGRIGYRDTPFRRQHAHRHTVDGSLLCGTQISVADGIVGQRTLRPSD